MLLGYRRFEGLAASTAITRLYGASRLFVNFFQPSFKLAARQRDGAKATKRYHPPQTPCHRLLQAEDVQWATKSKLREIAASLDPLKHLEEMASLSSAWHVGEIRPRFSTEAKPRTCEASNGYRRKPPLRVRPTRPSRRSHPRPQHHQRRQRRKPKPVYAETGQGRIQALRMAWPIAWRRLEEFPNIHATQLFEELCIQFPGRFTRKQHNAFARRVSIWRQAARAHGVVIGPKTYRLLSDRPRGRRPDIIKDDWEKMAQCLEERPDQTALELLVEFQARYPGRYSLRQLYTLQKRVRAWRQQAVQRLIGQASSLASYATLNTSCRAGR
ncbi:hypothetical protein [Mesorhizobium dulcispinae]|uniref:hypothetical protein n=1 Tax=Mesorhizobium dulcispinae TaxID=3072316 RepID=UPI002A2406E7|nr:hypothetical protein [Mesorhizobium sp. VK23D]MDX8522733.1 hypothetical protein [Mesorhizobium sp. VK23D]